ncbi:hypothetical protein [Variovorax sp. LT1R16]|uniref:hypothetical protein n=1 Tax=Variovorax sp. LT1R16 TaxID=3443728 RepID=UPI003F44E45F
MTRAERRPRTRAEWLWQSAAGTVLGFTLAIALSGLFAWLGPGGLAPLNKYQFNMWMVPPLWLGVLSAVFLFPSGAAAWGWLGAANLLTFGALLAVQRLGS